MLNSLHRNVLCVILYAIFRLFLDEPRQINGVKVYEATRECSMAGGVCVKESDCEPGEKAKMPGNGDTCANGSDVVCCYRGKFHD